jgi:predicted metal-dependent hydrolase
MIFDRFFRLKPEPPKPDSIQVGSTSVPLLFVHHPRARRYLLRLRSDGVASVTIPRRGSIKAARDFALRNVNWLGRQFKLQADRPKLASEWRAGTEIYFRGDLVRIEAEDGKIRFGTESIIADKANDFKPAIQKHLRKFAQNELPKRVFELASLHGIAVARVSVRNQKTRWGSCSRKGTISLNWRLIQAPEFVRDYIILHELAHRWQMNHSDKFWREVERLSPDYLTAEQWLKANLSILG